MPLSQPPFRAIAESTYDWETWVDGAGNVRWINAAVERFTGFTVQECLAMPHFPLEVVHDEDRAAMRELLVGAAGGTSGNDVEFRVARRDGTSVWSAISWQPLEQDGLRRGFRTSVRNIHARKLAEEALREAERAAARVAEERADFLAALSHELRSPLHCITGFAERLQSSAMGEPERRWVDIISEQSSAVSRLVEDLLLFVAGDARAREPRLEPFDLFRVVAAEVDAARGRARPGVRLALEATSPVTPETTGVLGDADYLRRIVANLVGNALRFTDRGRVDVSIGRSADGVATLVVSDTGIGMTPDLLRRVKQPFVQGAESTRASRGGVGLGLAIVDRLVAELGGELRIDSTPGEGTRITVAVPFQDAPVAADVESAHVAREGNARTRVLVVDDSDPVRELVVDRLRGLGVDPREAANADEAIQLARQLRPELVLVDLHMPGVDGVETVRRLRASGALAPDAFVVISTANVLASDASAPPPGVDAVLSKPVPRDALRELLGGRVRAATRAGSADGADEGDVDWEVIGELDALRDANGRSVLARRGPDIVARLRREVPLIVQNPDPESRRALGHELAGLSSLLGLQRVALGVRDLARAEGGGAARVMALEADLNRGVAAIEARFGTALEAESPQPRRRPTG